jgi:hypothetical protein
MEVLGLSLRFARLVWVDWWAFRNHFFSDMNDLFSSDPAVSG